MFEITIRDLDDPKDVSTFTAKCLIYAALEEKEGGVNGGSLVRECSALNVAMTIRGAEKACSQLKEKHPEIRSVLKLMEVAKMLETTEDEGGNP